MCHHMAGITDMSQQRRKLQHTELLYAGTQRETKKKI